MPTKQEIEDELAHFKREAKANQLILNRLRAEQPRPEPKIKAPAKPKAQPKPKKKTAKSR